MDATQATQDAYDRIMQSDLFRIDGEAIDLCEALISLCEAIDGEPDDGDWTCLGEFNECSAPDIIIGAFWTLTNWHAGQSSPEYAALSACGEIFSPGMTDGPEPDSGEAYAAEVFDTYFAKTTAPA